MRRKSIILLLTLLTISCFGQKNIRTIKANSNSVSIRDGDELFKDKWTITPEIKPDIYTTTVKKKEKTITFYTDLDSISLKVEANKTYDFAILLKEDTAFTQIKTIKYREPAIFSSEYIALHKEKWSVEIPEVQELVHIIIAISTTGIADSNMVEHEGEYYQKVIKHFLKYKDEKIVQKMDSILKGGYYARIKMDAVGFMFTKKGKIIKDKTYDRLNWSPNNYIEPFVLEIEEFAIKTSFRNFYNENNFYYANQISLLKKQIPIDNQWKWLEERFPIKYDNYRITFSPLVNGSHSTNHFENGNFKQTVMFICGPLENSKQNEKVVEGLMTRVVFTEIDHNYVNPLSDKYPKEINSVFENRDKWTSGNDTKNYGNAYSVFNEYMTWAVFTLYAYDTYNQEDFKIINDRTELQMTKWRGFSRFKEFNQKMLDLYKHKEKNQTIADLYPVILNWCEKE